MKRYLIIGNGVAGATAAESIKRLDPDGRITMLSAEADSFYSRPRLPEFMAGEVPVERITLRSKSWYADHGIELLLGTEAISADHQARTVTATGGLTLPYDELLLATGASSLVPPVQGAQAPGVFSLRTADDARAIGQAASRTKTAVLVGGGLLGLEAGAALARMGLTVRVAEFFDRLLPRQMDVQGAAKLQARLEGMGFSFALGARSKEIVPDDGGFSLILEDGRTLTGGLVLFSAGIRGNVELARQLGLAMDKGVIVDDRMSTSLPNVWAAGDHVEHRGRLYGLWAPSKAQGEVAGVNMAGGQAVYEGTVLSSSLKVAGIDLTSVGDIDADGKLESAVWQDADSYRKIVMENGVIKGFIFFGVTAGIKECRAAMDRKADVGALAPQMREADFDFKLLAG